ncbi:MAG: AIPR family protein [Thermodesulfovibrionales bacterium]
MSKYSTVITILDKIRNEAPGSFKRYSPPEDKIDEMNNARARTFIHLFLKVKFGMLDFIDREKYITDDPQDGGIDGYFIDEERKKVYFIQSKFRTTEGNFSGKEILFSELLQMDIDRITEGREEYENEVPYNSKIKKLIKALQNIPDIGRWGYEVIILANVSTQITQSQLKKLTGGFSSALYNHTRVYNELVFPVIQGTYYNPSELRLSINLSNTSSQSAKVTYKVKTAKKECDITLVFVPTSEIAKAMYRYRNSILKFNPRSYLELSNNKVNREIASSISDLETNEFALYNNGITVLSYGTDFNEKIGQKDKGQLILTQPQVINGGQTAFTLSRLYEENIINGNKPNIFENKEVLLKIITFHPDDQLSQNTYLELIESISKATNQQSQVSEADRRSNDQIQIQLQEFLFDKYGHFYERKRGEYADGVRAGYIQRSQIIDREIFMRMCKCCDKEPSAARRMGSINLFERNHFEKTLRDPNRFEEYLFAYNCFQIILQIKKTFSKDKNNKFGFLTYGTGLQFGMYAIVSACRLKFIDETSLSKTEEILKSILEKWLKFEEYAVSQEHNSDYFRKYTDPDTGEKKQNLNFNNYYKGRTLTKDLLAFFETR